MPISITSTRSTDNTRLIEVVGEVDILTAPTVRDAVYAQLHTGHPESVVLDLSGVTFFGVTGLCLLLDVRDVTAQYGARLRVGRISPPVSKVVNLAGLATLFDAADPRVTAAGSGE
jgi:anti-anti-sigma factor